MRQPVLSSWDCPGCGAKVRQRYRKGEEYVAWGSPCSACKRAQKKPGDARCGECGGLLSNPARRPCARHRDHGDGRS